MEESVRSSGFDVEYIHTGPVIRREEVFARYSIDERRKLLYKMLNFVNFISPKSPDSSINTLSSFIILSFINNRNGGKFCPISYLTVIVDRREATDKIALSGKLAKAINRALSEHIEFFSDFDRIIVYYDNGQVELSTILNAVFSIQFSNVEFRKAEPQKYRLLQAIRTRF